MTLDDFRPNVSVMTRFEGTGGLELATMLQAVDAAFAGGCTSLEEVALAAANGMPANASEFDRGVAAGMAIARYLRSSTKDVPQSLSN